ncbi:MAG TPA: phospho-N-acetylmuramoyl-pentapeptide-transferase [Oculatellaceae cyanobacterium]
MQVGSSGTPIDSLDYLIPSVVSVSCLVCVAFLPPYLKFLKKMQVGQVLREEGPKSHAHKARTPTAGGVSFIVATLVGSFLFAAVIAGYNFNISVAVFVAIMVGVCCASLGLADDLAKVKQNSNKGLSESIRLKIETALGLVYGVYLVWQAGGVYKIWLPLMGPVTNHLSLQPWAVPAWFAIPLITFIVVATANSANMHDGMDGLAAGTSFLIFCTFGFMSLSLAALDPVQLGYGALALTAAASMLGFFCFNRHPAKVFMGDTGSLFIGGLMAALTASAGLLIFFIPLVVIYILESASVLIQRFVYKLTKPDTPEKPLSSSLRKMQKMVEPLKRVLPPVGRKLPGEGRRVFLMAPLHHHYEALLAPKGIKEAQVVALFWIAQALICAGVVAGFLSVR